MSTSSHQNFNQLLSAVEKGTFANVYLLYGEEDFQIQQITEKLIETSLQPDEKDFNFDTLYANETDAAAIVNIAMSYPMMAERRVLLVKNLQMLHENDLQLLASYSSKASPTTVLILTATKLNGKLKAVKTLKENAVVFEAKPLYDNQVPGWLKGYAKQQGLTIDEQAAHLLQAHVGNHLRNLAVEIEKIQLNLKERHQVTIQDVESVVGVSKEYNVFEFNDAVVEQNASKSFRILNRLLQLGESPIGILVMLARHFFILSKTKELIRQNINRTEMASLLKVPVFFVDKYKSQAKRYSRQELERIYERLLEADRHLKTSYQKPQIAIEVLLLEIFNLNESVQ